MSKSTNFLLKPCSHYRTIICDQGKDCQSPAILGHRVYASWQCARRRACSLLQSSAVSCSHGSSWGTSEVGEFFKHAQKSRRPWNCQIGRTTDDYSIAVNCISFGVGLEWSPVVLWHPTWSPMLSLSISSRPRWSQAIPRRSPTIAELIDLTVPWRLSFRYIFISRKCIFNKYDWGGYCPNHICKVHFLLISENDFFHEM